MLQGLFILPKSVQIPWHHICSCLSAAYLSFSSTVCFGSVVITMIGSLKWALHLQEPTRDSCTQTHTHTSTLLLDGSLCHSCLSLWQQTCYDGRVDDTEEKLGLLRIRCLIKANYAGLMSAIAWPVMWRSLEGMSFTWAPWAMGLPKPESFASSLMCPFLSTF